MNYNQIANLYDEGEKVLLPTSAFSAPSPSQLLISYIPPIIVKTPTTLNFTITPTADINSYFVLKFPQGGLNDDYSLFSPACSLASKIDVYYRSDVVRVYPLTPHLANTTRNYLITGFPTSSYAIGPLLWNITV